MRGIDFQPPYVFDKQRQMAEDALFDEKAEEFIGIILDANMFVSSGPMKPHILRAAANWWEGIAERDAAKWKAQQEANLREGWRMQRESSAKEHQSEMLGFWEHTAELGF